MASQPLESWSGPTRFEPQPAGLKLVDTPSQLTELEWSIVAMARRDSLASLRKPNRFWKVIYAIFGLKPANSLANEGLEALRRVSVLAWRYRWNVPDSALQAFLDAGYSNAQYEQVQRQITALRSAAGRSRGR